MTRKPWHHATESNTARGYGTAWRKVRAYVQQRDKGLCQSCLTAGRVTVGNECDHILPKAKGGTDDPGNLQMLCGPCHADKTAREHPQAKPRLRFDDQGFPIW